MNCLSLIDSVKPAFREIVVVVFKVSNEVFLLVWVQHMETTLQTVIIGDHCTNNRCSRYTSILPCSAVVDHVIRRQVFLKLSFILNLHQNLPLTT